MQPAPQSKASQAELLTQRFRVIAYALMAAQIVYVLVGWTGTQGGEKAMCPDLPNKNAWLAAGLVVGLLLNAVSFVVTRRPAVGLQQISARFFVGFAVAEVAALLGLLLCFLFGTITVLAVLAVVTAGSIFAHASRAMTRLADTVDTLR